MSGRGRGNPQDLVRLTWPERESFSKGTYLFEFLSPRFLAFQFILSSNHLLFPGQVQSPGWTGGAAPGSLGSSLALVQHHSPRSGCRVEYRIFAEIHLLPPLLP